MIISKENIDDLNAVLKVQVEKADYDEKVEKVLRDYRRKANLKGFRPGKVPYDLIRKMYGKAVRIEEINKAVTESIQKYLADEKIDILGDPMPKTDEHEKIDFDNQESFTFLFDLGLTPDFEIKLSKKNKVAGYEIEADEKMKNDYLENYRRRFGKFEKSDMSEDKDLLRGKIEALDDTANPENKGLFADDTTLGIDLIRDDEIKKQFIGKTTGDSIDFDLRKALPNDHEIAGLLKRKNDEAESIDGRFRFTINEITRFKPAETGQELFDRIYGEGVIGSEEEFRKRIEEEISANLKQETDLRLASDIRALAIARTEFSLPEEFLKRWLLQVNEQATEEQIEKDFDSFRQDLKWQLIKNKIARDNEIKITQEELLQEAENITRYQFRQYGLFYAADEQIANYARETLKRGEDAKRIADKILDEKVLSQLKEMVKIDARKVTIEEFNKLFEQ